MDTSEWANWTEAMQRVESPVSTPCDDCLVGFALEMRDIGRCDGHPGGFEDDHVVFDASEARAHIRRSEDRRERIEQAVRLRLGGLKHHEIAEAMSLERSTVSMYLKEAGLPTRRRRAA